MDQMLEAIKRRMGVLGDQKPLNDKDAPGSPFAIPSQNYSQMGDVSLSQPKPIKKNIKQQGI